MEGSTSASEGWVRPFVEKIMSAVFLLGFTALFIAIGARGPKATHGTFHNMYSCLVPQPDQHIWNQSAPLIDDTTCSQVGRPFIREDEDPNLLQHYPMRNIIFFAYVPYMKKEVMSREFEFLLMDLGIQFTFSGYVKEFMDKKENFLKFQVVLAYRDKVKGRWTRKATGNVTRTVNCRAIKTAKDILTCDHFPLLELGSCHHKHYLINLFFPELPLGYKEEYKGFSQLSRLSLFGVHQSPSFTRLWLWLKTILFPITLLAVVLYLLRLARVSKIKRSGASLVERSLGFVGICLALYNVPFQYLSYYYDCPWLLVFNDFRQGLFIASLFSFWIIFVAEHNPEKDVNSHIGYYWQQMGVVTISSVFLFVYEFCERGIQVLFPFYSLWGSSLGVSIAYTFVGVAAGSSILYLLIFIVTLVKTFRNLRKKQKELMSLSPSLRPKVARLFGNLRFFLVVTFLVAVCSIGTIVLPSEILLHQWQHNDKDYNIYSGILTGNYAVWNAYCMIMLYIYAPTVSMATQSEGAAVVVEDEAALKKLISKKSQS